MIGRFGALDLRPWYWFALALVALALVVNVNLRDSRIGRAWVAMRDDEPAAASAGIPIVRTKLLAYGTGAAFGGISGAFFAAYLGVVNAGQFEFSFSIFILAMVVLGGAGSITGVVVGAIILSVLNSYLLPDVLFDLPSKVGLDFRPGGDQLRHLRRDPRAGDASPAAGARAGPPVPGRPKRVRRKPHRRPREVADATRLRTEYVGTQTVSSAERAGTRGRRPR